MTADSPGKILLEECPSFTSSGFDTDIELYTTLVSDKKYTLANRLYEKKLIPRYPDEANRIRIIRYFRKRDYRFKDVYSSAVKDLHNRIIFSVKRLIDFISSLFEEKTLNPYELLKRIDKALQVLPSDKKAAARFIRKLSRYSVLLNYKTEKFVNASDILERYFDNTLFVKKKRPSPEKKVKTEKQAPKKVTIDLDAVEFSDEDISKICINRNIVKRTYKVLAYCRLYWKQIYNQDFEKKVFLYSRKYNTNHYKIFLFVKNGRIRKLGDDVILLELYSLLSSGYRYSVHEDLLMQKIWKKIKPADIPAKKKFTKKKSSVPLVPLVSSEIRNNKNEEKTGKETGFEKKKTDSKTETAKSSRKKRKLKMSDIYRQSLKKKLDLLSFREVFDAHEVFSSLLPGYIEKYLVKHRKKGSGNDPYILKGALYIIQNYIKLNYDSLTYDWSISVEKQETANIGFIVPEIDTIIAMCLEEVRMRRAAV